jgi:hypothetical protein
LAARIITISTVFVPVEKLKRLDDVIIEPLPKVVCAAFNRQLGGKYPNIHIPDADFSHVDESLVRTLMPFQREGVRFVSKSNYLCDILDKMLEVFFSRPGI